MQILKKSLLLAVVLAIVFSLSACGYRTEEATPTQKPTEETATEEEEESIPERKTATIKIDYENPELYLAPGTQSSLDKKYSDEIRTQITIESNSIKGVAEIFRWKQDHFSTYSAGGKFIGQITVNQIMNEKILSGCHDHALVLVSVLREYGFPAIMVDTAGIQWALDYSEGKREDFAGHVFVEVYVDDSWVLINSTSGEYVEDYDPYNPVIPMTNSDESIGYYALLKGLDPEEYGIASLQQLREYLKAFAKESKSIDMHFPQYEIKKFSTSPSPTPIPAAIASISGGVVDFSTKQPVEKAMVNIGNKSYLTDSAGSYNILEIPAGTLTVNVTATDYEDYSNIVEIQEGPNIIANILLAPETIPPSDSGLLLTYTLTLQEDTSNKLHMNLRVRNIASDSLKLVINNTIMDDYENVYDLFNIVSNLYVTNPSGDNLPFVFSETSIVPENWYLSWWRGGNRPIHYDVLTIDTKGNSELVLEYEVISSMEMWLAWGVDSTFPGDHPRDFWAGYLEWLLYRPQEHVDVRAAKLIIELPDGWRSATIYPSLGEEVDLEKIDYMYGDNIRWKNYQRSNFVLFKDGPFKLASKMIKDTNVQEVYSTSLAGQRNHEAGFQYFEYLSESIGPLPVNAVLTFFPVIPTVDAKPDPSIPYVNYLRLFQAGPYGWPHGLMGEYFGAGGDIGMHSGRSLPQVQLWDFNSLDNSRSYSFPPHGIVRYWLMHLLQTESANNLWIKEGLDVYYENMCVASRYGLDEVIERRFKPMYQYYIDNIAGPPEVDQINFTNASFLNYYKRALTFFYINEQIKEQSGGTKSLDDAMKLLYEKALAGEAVSRESLIMALNSLTERDFTQVVDDYLYGDKELNLDRWLK